MGKEIDRIAAERGIHIVCRMTSRSAWDDKEVKGSDVAIHFARPDSVLSHVQRLASLNKNVVVGTTGWQDDLEKVRSIVQESKIGLVYASNFSVGVQIFFRLLKDAARLINKFPDYDVTVHETHHQGKVDSPSGTALSAAKILLEDLERKKTILTEPPHGKIRPDQLQVTSTRVGAVVGEHNVAFDSVADSIELKHEAKNRSGFALGALLAAEWVLGKQGLFTMDDVLADIFR